MDNYEHRLSDLLSSFHRISGIGFVYLDQQFDVALAAPNKGFKHILAACGYEALTDYLSRLSFIVKSADSYYTYYIKPNLVINLVPVFNNGLLSGFISTEPFLFEKPSDDVLSAIDDAELKSVLMDAPVLELGLVADYGRLMASMCQNLTRDFEPRQVVAYAPEQNQVFGRRQDIVRQAVHTAQKSFEPPEGARCYSSFRDVIYDGDIEAMNALIADLKPEMLTAYCPDGFELSSWARHMLTLHSSMACAFAADAGAPLQPMSDYIGRMASSAAQSSQIHKLLDMMKNALIYCTRAVASHRSVYYSKPVCQTLEYIKNHYAEKITLEKLSDYTGLSTYYLSNLIKKETGLSLIDNINKTRVEHAKNMLSGTNSSILDIALQTGFNYQNHFASVFKKFVGLTPSEYRKFKGIRAGSADARNLQEPISIVVEILNNRLNMLSGLGERLHIIDPANESIWSINGDCCERLTSELQQANGLSNHAAHEAISKNSAVVSIEKLEDAVYLAITIPIFFGDSAYAAYLRTDITMQYIRSLKNTDSGMIADRS